MKIENRLKILFIVVLILVVASIIIIKFVHGHESFNESLRLEELPVTLDKVNIEIKKETLTKKGVTIIITNKSDSIIAFGEDYRIDKKENQRWMKMKSINKNHITLTTINEIGKEESIEKRIDWSNLYGTLKKGNYRIVKEIYGLKEIDGFDINNYVAVEFTIE